MTAILERLRAMGAFAGTSARDCYLVTCDRSTMTRGDIDAGRVRCDVVLNPASPIDRIEVNLALIDPGAAGTQREAA
jgi:phage tail sheath protein FI